MFSGLASQLPQPLELGEDVLAVGGNRVQLRKRLRGRAGAIGRKARKSSGSASSIRAGEVDGSTWMCMS